MNNVNIPISDERLLQLEELATDLNVSVEELVLIGIEDLLARRKASVTSPDIANKFYALAEKWQNEMEGVSSTVQMSQHPAYQEIISLGHKVVPLLLKELKKNPLYWLSALNTITGENPIKPEQKGKVKQMAEAWIEWGKNQGYVV